MPALMLVHVHNDILDNINLAHVANQFVGRKDGRKQTSDNFLRIIHNICKIQLALKCFSYIYISYQMYKNWSC